MYIRKLDVTEQYIVLFDIIGQPTNMKYVSCYFTTFEMPYSPLLYPIYPDVCPGQSLCFSVWCSNKYFSDGKLTMAKPEI